MELVNKTSSGYVRCTDRGTFVAAVSSDEAWEKALDERIGAGGEVEPDAILAETGFDGKTRFYRRAPR